MARLARIVAPGCPQHVRARGNRREPIFFEDGDQEIYRDILAAQMRQAEVEVWADRPMPNHVHLVLTPHTGDGLARRIADGRIESMRGAAGRGHLFDGRFASVAMDEAHLFAAVRYVSLNPVRAGLAVRAQDWAWSSVRAHLEGEDDGLVIVKRVLDRCGGFAAFLGARDDDERTFAAIRAAETTGPALGPADFVADFDRRLGRQSHTPTKEPIQS